MSDSPYPLSERKLVNTLTELCLHQGCQKLEEILTSSHASLEETGYDSLYGGTTYFTLMLNVPVSIFAQHGEGIETLEHELLNKIQTIDRAYTNHILSEVKLIPVTQESTVYGQRLTPSKDESDRLWPEGTLRLFLSHLAIHKTEAHRLKQTLSLYGISAFVAHDDIEPSRQWCDEIELALKTMDTLVALVTPGFKESNYCDQEVGWALGRGIPVISARLGSDPYGFAGKFQAISGSLAAPWAIATAIVTALKEKPGTRDALYKSLPLALVGASSFDSSRSLSELIVEYDGYSDSDKKTLWKACKDNSQVYGSWGVVEAITSHIGQHPIPHEALTIKHDH